jgi:hypothetical protein
MVALAIDDMAELAALPEKVRLEVRRWQRQVGCIEAEAESRGRQKAVLRAATALGVSERTVWRKLSAWEESADWRVFINRAMTRREGEKLPKDFVALFRRMCERNQRKSRPAWRELVRMWRRGEAIEGYAERPVEWKGSGLPKGWSYSNLMKAYRATDFELKAMREGLGAAISAYGPQVLKTRVGLWVGSHYLVDDVKRDMKLLLLGKGGQEVCPQELGVLDLFSGDRFAVHRRPMYLREDGVRDSIKEKEMRYLAAAVLRNTGYSPRGTEWVSELGTAALRSKIAAWMAVHSGGKISVREPGIQGREQAIAGWQGRGGGNPRHKAPLESHHNLIQNEAGSLLAQVGHDRNPPEWLHGIEAETERVLKLLRTLPPEMGAMLAVNMVEYWQGLDLLALIDEEIAWRTDHVLEGWEECGHVTLEFRRDAASQEWLTPMQLMTLSDGERAEFLAVARVDDACRRPRKLSPREVWRKGAGDLVRLPDHEIALLFCDRDLGDDLRRVKRLTPDHDFEIQDRTVEPETMHFLGTVERPDGSTLLLEERVEHWVVLNPFDREALWVFRGDGSFVGTSARIRRAGMGSLSSPALDKQLGYRSKTLAAMTAPLIERHADMAARLEAMQLENAAVASGKRPEDLARAKREAREDLRHAASPGDFVSSLPSTDDEAMPIASPEDFL